MASKAEFVNQVYQAGLAAGLTDAAARVMAGQAALESGYGDKAHGFNYFGIKGGNEWKGPTETRLTTEGSGKNAKQIKQSFRVYASPDEGIADRLKYMDSHFPGFSQSSTVDDALNVLQNGRLGKYYTADRSTYENAVNSVTRNYLPQQVTSDHPVPPRDVPQGSGGPKIIDLTQGGTVGGQNIPANASKTPRGVPIKGVVFHHTAGNSLSSALYAGTQNKGATYYIDTDGQIYRYAPDDVVRVGIRDPDSDYRTDKGKPTSGLSNGDTISVEVVGADSDHFTDAQRQAAAQLGAQLASTYKIDPTMIVGHGDIQGGAGGNKMPTEGVDLASYVRTQTGTPNGALSAIDSLTTGVPLPRPRPAGGRSMAEILSAPVPRQRPTDMTGSKTLGASMGDQSTLARLLTTRLNTDNPEASDIRQVIPSRDYDAARINSQNVGGLGSTSDTRLGALLAPQSGGPQFQPGMLGRSQAKTITNPAYTDWAKKYAAATSGANAWSAGDANDYARYSNPGGVSNYDPRSTIPKAPPKTITINTPAPAPTRVASAPAQHTGGFSIGGMLGGLTGAIGTKAQQMGGMLGTAVQGTQNALATTATNATDLLKNELMGTVKGRTLLLNTLMGNRGTIQSNPGKYGATFGDRQLAAQNRERLQQGLPPMPTGGGSQMMGMMSQPPQNHAIQAINNATADDRRRRQIAEGKASQLDQFGMIR